MINDEKIILATLSLKKISPKIKVVAQLNDQDKIAFLKRANVDFAVLGQKETCTGDPARRLGNEYLYQNMANQTIATLKAHKVRKIITLCPHCFNVMKNEYPHLEGDFDVIHYSKFVDELISLSLIHI